MPPHHLHHEKMCVSGEVINIFAHRFVVKTEASAVLADLTPHGADVVELRIGDLVTIEGEQHPSEIKVCKLERGRHIYVIAHKHDHHKKPHHDPEHGHASADPAIALKSAKAAGYKVLGEPRRKPKHFEVLGLKGQSMKELHIELDGNIRKAKPVSVQDGKWSAEISAVHNA